MTDQADRFAASPVLMQSLRENVEGALDVRNHMVMEVLVEALRCGRRGSSFEVLALNSNDVIAALLQWSNGEAQRGRTESPGYWLATWLANHDATPRPFSPQSTDLSSFTRVELSTDLRTDIVDRASAIARVTVRGGKSGVRELILAAVRSPTWRNAFQRDVSREEVLTLHDYLVECMISNAEDYDLAEGWASLRFQTAAQTSPNETSSPNAERVRTITDGPATTDGLGRAAFATVLAERLIDARSTNEADLADQALMVHLHGAWGSGKSSVLNMLKADLTARPTPWVVVEFNAWRHQRLRPPWWPFLASLYQTAVEQAGFWGKAKLRWLWWSWRLRADWLPLLLLGCLLGGATTAIMGLIRPNEVLVQLLAALLAASAGVLTYVRFLVFGSTLAVETYNNLRSDPLKPIIDLHARIVRAVGQPIVVFIDDLDRCDGPYVIELIEGIQTLFRSPHVSYVVACDRAWLSAAFQATYREFEMAMAEPGRSLGHLFIDKFFQVSVALPRLSEEHRSTYWQQLLGDPKTKPMSASAMSEARSLVVGADTVEELQKIIEMAPSSQKPAVQAAAAVQITQYLAEKRTEHRLAPYAQLLEDNPRAMKRLVNTVGLAQARCLLEGRASSIDSLVRWSLIELRWPALAEHLSAQPSDIARLHDRTGTLTPTRNVDSILALRGDPALSAVIGMDTSTRLDEHAIRQLIC